MKTIIIIGVLVLAILFVLLFPCFNIHEYTVTVTDKDRIVESSGNGENSHTTSKYLIFTKTDSGEVRVFQNTDLIFQWKFGSSDIQAKLEIGNTYNIKVVGWRVPFLSWYENIITVE
jgi:hypothetical protein